MMMNDEDFLKQQVGNRNPFTVPDGYFDMLEASLMASLPPAEPAKPALVRRLRPLLYAAAACLAAVVVSVAVYRNAWTGLGQQQLAAYSQQPEQSAWSTYSDSYFDEAADYAMMGNDEIYATLLADI